MTEEEKTKMNQFLANFIINSLIPLIKERKKEGKPTLVQYRDGKVVDLSKSIR